jgi:hypothetical protein
MWAPVREGTERNQKEETNMKPFATRLFATAATTLTVTLLFTFGAATASAQKINGNIPFAFSVDHKQMQPGTYTIVPVTAVANGAPLVLRNLNDNSNVLAGVVSQVVTPRNDKPRVEFLCGAENCRLVRVFSGSKGWEIVQPRHNKAEAERLATIYLAPEAGF